jgi:hypothetical protein
MTPHITSLRPLALLAGLTAATLSLEARATPATVSVEYVHPENFTDINNYGHFGSLRAEEIEAVLTTEFKTQGARCLAENQSLKIEVRDVRLAGQSEWWRFRGNSDARVMRESTWPSIRLDYQWSGADGLALEQAHADIADMNYLGHAGFETRRQDPLPYERAMLRAWFDRVFCIARDASRVAPPP